jgi:hypothetical protein
MPGAVILRRKRQQTREGPRERTEAFSRSRVRHARLPSAYYLDEPELGHQFIASVGMNKW